MKNNMKDERLNEVVGGEDSVNMINYKYEIGDIVIYNHDQVEITNRRIQVLFGGTVRLYEVRGVRSDIIAIDVEESQLKPVLKEDGLF